MAALVERVQRRLSVLQPGPQVFLTGRVLTAIGTMIVVNFALRPLRRVAAVAGQVAALPLDTTEYRITARVSPADTDPGSEIGVVGRTLNRLLANVDSALGEIAASDRRTRQFLTDASHELRTPLAAILGYAELTRQDSDVLPPTTEYALARIEAESRRMTSLVDDLLLLSRLDEGGDLELEDVDLCDVVADAVNDASVTAPDHHFVIDLPDHGIWVRGDRARLHQLLTNLLGNARVHTPVRGYGRHVAHHRHRRPGGAGRQRRRARHSRRDHAQSVRPIRPR